MKRKIFIAVLFFFAFGVFVFVSSNRALAVDKSTETVIAEADQFAEAPDTVVETDMPAEEKLTPPEVHESEGDKGDHGYEKPAEDLNSENIDENSAPEIEVAPESNYESSQPAEGADVEGESQHQHEGESEQEHQAPESE
ncbi:MAG: hypothetical protein AB1847_07525 [bacterium]